MISKLFNFLNQDKYFYGLMMILLNIGSKYIELDLNNQHKQFLSSTAIRRIGIFTIAFIATRDILASLVITACFIIFVLNLFNSDSDYCILPKSIKELDKNNDGKISPEEIKNAYDTLQKAGKIN